MATLFDATLALAKCLGGVLEGTVDASPAPSSTFLADTKLSRRKVSTYSSPNGTIWITTGARIGQMRRVTKNPPGSLTFDALTGTLTAADKYAVFTGIYPLFNLVQAINQAIEGLGPLGQYDETLVTVASQEDYTLPAAVQKLASVHVAQFPTAPRRWREHRHWMQTAAGKLRFAPGWEPGIAGQVIRLGHNAPHAALVLDADTLDRGIEVARLKWEATIWIYRNWIAEGGVLPSDDPRAQLLNEAKDELGKSPPHMLPQIAMPLMLGSL